jgi:hypothetical protein
MAAFSDYYEDQIIDHMLRGQAFSPAGTVYIALFDANTGLEANSPTGEISGNAYARQAVTLSAASGGASSNSADVTFPTATGSWGTVTSAAIVDHATNTTWGTDVNVLMWADLSTSKTVDTDDVFKFLAGDFDVSVA